MIDYFAEKMDQVSVDSMRAFGIEISTRHGRANELAEMILFARAAAIENVHHLVKSVFYDSNACLCTFEYNTNLELGDPKERLLFNAALETIGQFEWFGSCYHKEGC
jgi:hypothetical protein